MFYCYILYSQHLDSYYIGFCSNLESRLEKHLQHHKGFTGRTRDWILKYSEGFSTKKEALARERQLKKWKSRKLIENLINAKE